MQEQTITLNVTVDDANGILHALSQLPYVQVVALLTKIKTQAESQLQAPQEAEAAPTVE